MLKDHVVAVGSVAVPALGERLLEEAPHAPSGGARREELRDEHERLVEGRVDAAHHQQEAEEGEKVAGALEHEGGAREQGGGKPQAQHDLRAVHADAGRELPADGGALRLVHALVDALEVALLLVGGAHLAHALERLLDELGGPEPRQARPAHERLDSGAHAKEQKQRHRARPHGRNRQPPVEGEQAHEGDRHGGVGAVELGEHVAVGVLGGLDVSHERLGEVREVSSAKEREGEPAQALGEGHALPPALLVDDAVLVVVGKPLAHEEDDEVGRDRGRPAGSGHGERVKAERSPGAQLDRPAREPRHERAHDDVDEPHARKDHEVGHRGPHRAEEHVPHALVREGVLLLDRHHRSLPSAPWILQLTARS